MKFDLPSLAALKNEKDWKHWWNGIKAYFEVLEPERFLIENIPEPIDPDMLEC